MSSESEPVEVELIVPNDFSKSGEASVRVLVEDVSEADARAKPVAQKVIETKVEPGKHFFVTVAVPREALDPKRSYNVRAHLSMTHEDTVQRGDLITTQSFPVLTEGRASRRVLPLREVK